MEVVVLEEGWLGGLVRVTMGEREVGNLASEANFARFAFHSLFPLLHRAIYIDTDTVVQVHTRHVGIQYDYYSV